MQDEAEAEAQTESLLLLTPGKVSELPVAAAEVEPTLVARKTLIISVMVDGCVVGVRL